MTLSGATGDGERGGVAEGEGDDGRGGVIEREDDDDDDDRDGEREGGGDCLGRGFASVLDPRRGGLDDFREFLGERRGDGDRFLFQFP